MLRGDGDHLAHHRVTPVPADGAQDLRRAADDLHPAVVRVLVRDEEKVGLGCPRSADSRTASLFLGKPSRDAERVDEDRPVAAEGETPIDRTSGCARRHPSERRDGGEHSLPA